MAPTRRNIVLMLGGLALAGCAKPGVPVAVPGPDVPRPVPRPGSVSPPGRGRAAGRAPGNARSPEALDTTSRQEREAALRDAAAGAGEKALGRTIASLGDPTRPGFWLETPLVRAPGRGRVVLPESGASVALDLLPSGAEPGAGSRLSLAAMRLLGVALTDLPELVVYAR